ncbi:Uncharacterized protein TCM_044824 [Theobroma cacao]|uniref:Uncharacterized protein n=1 Tax=Theobroma cacao TaxID=3641 RepID=A0A061FY15_THECC|nr:Uncharacterized protein TCM_044824 [Theobroma cacao]
MLTNLIIGGKEIKADNVICLFIVDAVLDARNTNLNCASFFSNLQFGQSLSIDWVFMLTIGVGRLYSANVVELLLQSTQCIGRVSKDPSGGFSFSHAQKVDLVYFIATCIGRRKPPPDRRTPS